MPLLQSTARIVSSPNSLPRVTGTAVCSGLCWWLVGDALWATAGWIIGPATLLCNIEGAGAEIFQQKATSSAAGCAACSVEGVFIRGIYIWLEKIWCRCTGGGVGVRSNKYICFNLHSAICPYNSPAAPRYFWNHAGVSMLKEMCYMLDRKRRG